MIIVYDPMFNDFMHNGNIITDMEAFLFEAMKTNKTIEIKELKR